MSVGALQPTAVSTSLRVPLSPTQGQVIVRVEHDGVDCDPDDNLVQIDIECPSL